MPKRFNTYLIKSVITFFLAFMTNAALAEKNIDFAGFASIVYGKTTADKSISSSGDFRAMRDGDARNFSLLGLRMTAQMDRFSFVAQAVIYGKDDFKPKFDWAYMDYDIGAGWSVSLGRTRTPLFMYSMYQDVSYTYPWIKPPFSVYGIPQFKSVDGLKFRQQTVIGDNWGSDLQFWYGSVKERLQEIGLDGDLELKDNAGIAWDLERSFLRLHMVYMYSKSNMDLSSNESLAAILGGFDNLMSPTVPGTQTPNPIYDPSKVAQLSVLKNELLWQDRTTHFVGLGAGLDFDTYFFNAEATYIKIEDNVASPHDMQSYYIMAGIRPVAKWTFALTISRDRDREADSLFAHYRAIMNTTNIPALANPALSGLQADKVLARIGNMQHYDAVGLTLSARWDFHKQASAKIEYMAEVSRAGGTGNYQRPQAVRAGVDLVF